jgi:hypothetical protein
MKIIRAGGQTLFDIALQYCGSAQAAYDIARLNDISLTDEQSGEIEVPAAINARLAKYFRDNGLCPATFPVGEIIERIFDYTFDETFE